MDEKKPSWVDHKMSRFALAFYFHDIVICIRRYLFHENASGQQKRYAILMEYRISLSLSIVCVCVSVCEYPFYGYTQWKWNLWASMWLHKWRKENMKVTKPICFERICDNNNHHSSRRKEKCGLCPCIQLHSFEYIQIKILLSIFQQPMKHNAG